jgi:hypothetical protein
MSPDSLSYKPEISIDLVVSDIVETIDGFGDILGVKYTKTFQEDISSVFRYSGLCLDESKKSVIRDEISSHHVHAAYEAIKDLDPDVVHKVLRIMVEYEVIHHQKKHTIKTISAHRYYDAFNNECFYLDPVDEILSSIQKNERNKDTIDAIQYLHSLEISYWNTIEPLVNKESVEKRMEGILFQKVENIQGAVDNPHTIREYDRRRKKQRESLLNSPQKIYMMLLRNLKLNLKYK